MHADNARRYFQKDSKYLWNDTSEMIMEQLLTHPLQILCRFDRLLRNTICPCQNKIKHIPTVASVFLTAFPCILTSNKSLLSISNYLPTHRSWSSFHLIWLYTAETASSETLVVKQFITRIQEAILLLVNKKVKIPFAVFLGIFDLQAGQRDTAISRLCVVLCDRLPFCPYIIVNQSRTRVQEMEIAY
jgi:hypothetical protein